VAGVWREDDTCWIENDYLRSLSFDIKFADKKAFFHSSAVRGPLFSPLGQPD
jgi:hypothetical protein